MIKQIREMSEKGIPIRKIARALGLSRNTVRGYLRDESVGSASAHDPEPPLAADLPPWARGPSWDRVITSRNRGVTLKQLYAEYQPCVSYSRFCRIVRRCSATPVALAPRLIHLPGERVQIDFADGLKVIDARTGKEKKTQLYCGVLPFSSYTYAEFTLDQKLTQFIRCHENMWAFFGGVTPYVVIDNLKAGVTKAHRYDPDTNPTYCDYGNHSGFAVLPARPYTPRDKASVESAIGVLQRTFFQKFREHKFYSLAEMNARLREFLTEFNQNPMRETGVSRVQIFETERQKLLPLPKEPYELVEWREARVHPDCCIQVLQNFYSIPFRRVGQKVKVKVTHGLVEAFSDDGERLACHLRTFGRGVTVIDDAHLPPKRMQESSFEIHSSKTKARSIGPKMAELITIILDGDRPLRYLRRAQGILRLSEKLSTDSLEYAAGQAMTFQRYRLAYIKNVAEHFSKVGSRPKLSAPVRDPQTINLHGV